MKRPYYVHTARNIHGEALLWSRLAVRSVYWDQVDIAHFSHKDQDGRLATPEAYRRAEKAAKKLNDRNQILVLETCRHLRTADMNVEKILALLGEALVKFGTYSFDDKGPEEVMNLRPIQRDLRRMGPEEAANILRKLARAPEHGGRGKALAGALLVNMQDWNELFDEPDLPDM